MEHEDAKNRLSKFKKESLSNQSFLAIGEHKDGKEFELEEIDDAEHVKKIFENDGFKVKSFKTGDFTGDYLVRLSCGYLNKPFLDSSCHLTAIIEDESLEKIETNILESIDDSITESFCSTSQHLDLCKKSVSMGMMSKVGKDMIRAFRASIEHELLDVYDSVEFREKYT